MRSRVCPILAWFFVAAVCFLSGCSNKTATPYSYDNLNFTVPEHDLYISLTNQDCDFYPNTAFTMVSVKIVTAQWYDPDQIQVVIPMRTTYEVVSIRDLSEYCHMLAVNGVANLGLANYQYLYMRDVDWHALGVMAMDSASASKYIQTMQEYEREYEAMPEEKIPVFYAYDVTIRFSGLIDEGTALYEETVETVDFILGGKTYTVDIGQWRFHTELPSALAVEETPGLSQYKVLVTAITNCSYNGGYVVIPGALSFTASDDITVTGLRILKSDLRILGGRIQAVAAQDGEVDIDSYWDGEQTLRFGKGSKVSIDLYFQDTCFQEYEVNRILYLLMDYEASGAPHTMLVPCNLVRYNNVWDMYFRYMAGYDIGKYFTNFYVPQYEGWIEDLPAEWRR